MVDKKLAATDVLAFRPDHLCDPPPWFDAMTTRSARDTVAGYLPLIYEAKMDEDWLDPEVWRRANPNLGGLPPVCGYPAAL